MQLHRTEIEKADVYSLRTKTRLLLEADINEQLHSKFFNQLLVQIFDILRGYGVYQIGEVYARSWCTIGTLASIVTPKCFAS